MICLSAPLSGWLGLLGIVLVLVLAAGVYAGLRYRDAAPWEAPLQQRLADQLLARANDNDEISEGYEAGTREAPSPIIAGRRAARYRLRAGVFREAAEVVRAAGYTTTAKPEVTS